LPRVGNKDFADFVDTIFPNEVVHINNKKDPVPIVPGMDFGYVHPQGEIHIQEVSEEWIECPGQDNADPRCIVGTVTSIFNAQFSDHSGPYNGILLKC
jgi:Lipase (class 3)